MKLRNLFMAVIAGAAMLVGCNKEVDLGPAKLDVSKDVVSFEAAEASQEITFTATRDWVLSGMPNWIAVNAESGVGSSTPQKLVIDVIENKEFNRQASLVITIGYARKVITVNQAGPEGEKSEGTGTMADPYTVAGVIDYLKDLGADVNSPKKVFVKGKVSALASKESDQFGGTGNTYGNGSFTMSDDGSVNGGQFKAYRINYLGNKKFAAGDTPVEVGDEVIVYGNVVNYQGNTPETQQNQAFLYSLNGENRGGVEEEPGDDGEEVPDESLEPAGDTNIAGLVAKISKTATQNEPTAISDFALASATVTYVNGSSAYIEDKSGAVLLYKSGHGLKAGDVLSGTLSTSGYYRYGVPQLTTLDGITPTAGEAPAPTEMTIEKLLSTYTSQLSRYIILKNVTVTTGMDSRKAVVSQGDKSVNVYAGLSSGLNLAQDATGDIIVFPTLYNTTKQVSFWENSHFTGNGSDPVTPPAEEIAKGTGTEADPFNPKAANDEAAKLESGETGENDVYIKGKICEVRFAFDAEHGTATFFISETGEKTGTQFQCYGVKPVDNKDSWAEGDPQIKVGDEVVICGRLTNYNGTLETASKKAYIVSINAGGSDEPGEVTPGTAGTYSFQFSDVSALSWPTGKGAGASTQVYPLNGVNYTFTLSDNVYTSTYDGSSYLMLASKTAAAPVYLGLPAFDGLKLVKVAVTTSSGASKSAHGVITSDQNGTVVAGGEDKTLSEQSTEFTWELTGTEAGKVYYYSSPSASYNSQIVKLDLTYSDGEGGDEPGGDDPEQPKLPVNDGLTEDTAFTVEDAIYVAKNGTEDKEYYVKAVVGKDISIKNGVASFELVDGTTDGKLTVVKAKSFKGEAFDGTEPIEWLDEVILKGKVTEYSTLPALVDGQLVKWNGLPVFDAQFSTIAELNALCTTTATEYVGTLENAVVSFVPSPSNAVIKDATGSILLFKTDHGLKQGQTFSGLVNVTALMYKGNYTELTAIDAAFAGDEAAVEPQTVTLAQLAEDGYDKWQNAYVTIKNMEVTAVDKKNVSVKGSDWLMFSNAGNATCAVGDMITVTGTVTKYNSTLEVKAWTMDAIVKAEPAFSTVAELNAACTATAQELVGKLTDAVVSFVPDNKNAVIKDATGSILLHKTDHGLKQGQTFSGWTTVKAELYNNAGELTAMDAAFTGDEAAVAPEALSLATLAADFAKYQNAYVVVENLEVTAVSGKNINVKDGENTYVVYSSAGNATCKVGAVIKATGTVAQYNGNGQIKAWSLDAIEVTKEAPAEETPATAITLSFASITTAKNGYTDTWKQTCGDYSWTLANFNNNNGGWTYVKCGRKNNASVATITTDAAFTQAITNVVVTYDSYNAAKVNSTKLYVASDAEFTQNVQTVSGSVAGAGAYTYTITTPTANMYYKLEVDCASHTANGFVQISKVVYNY